MNKSLLRKLKYYLIYFWLFVLALIAAFSSTKPDGLERMLQILALEKTSDGGYNIPFAGYVISTGLPKILNRTFSALVGMGIIILLFLLIYKISTFLQKWNRIDNAT